ncbi:armadillo-type protein [Mycena metata]|uniref:Armadillo-type protein n=1 Tax=Mycena metata TaxID=1033252 RepID=A0AAD7HK00_9AGAR|nr:armadillo-type protein [Mycena metata]
MPPLTRQRTPQSLHSEWSRNSLGATISIHALAKPLMKVMYHRAVLDLIKRQRDIPLSVETMQIYISYLSGDNAVVVEGACYALARISRDLDGAKAVVKAGALETVQSLLISPPAGVRRWTSKMLAELAFHPSMRRAVVTAEPCPQLVALLVDDNAVVVEEVCHALSHISHDMDGARAVVGAGGLEIVQHLLASQYTEIRRYTCLTLGRLASHSSTRGVVVAAQPCPRLVALLGDDNADTVEGAYYALSQISRNLDGATAVVEAGALGTVQNLFTSPPAGVRRWTSEMLVGLAFHPSTRGAVVAAQPCPQLVALLG